MAELRGGLVNNLKYFYQFAMNKIKVTISYEQFCRRWNDYGDNFLNYLIQNKLDLHSFNILHVLNYYENEDKESDSLQLFLGALGQTTSLNEEQIHTLNLAGLEIINHAKTIVITRTKNESYNWLNKIIDLLKTLENDTKRIGKKDKIDNALMELKIQIKQLEKNTPKSLPNILLNKIFIKDHINFQNKLSLYTKVEDYQRQYLTDEQFNMFQTTHLNFARIIYLNLINDLLYYYLNDWQARSPHHFFSQAASCVINADSKYFIACDNYGSSYYENFTLSYIRKQILNILE